MQANVKQRGAGMHPGAFRDRGLSEDCQWVVWRLASGTAGFPRSGVTWSPLDILLIAFGLGLGGLLRFLLNFCLCSRSNRFALPIMRTWFRH